MSYKPYWIREDYLNGLYETKTDNDSYYIDQVIKLFRSEKRTISAMSAVVRKWKYAAEHNLTNHSINRIAWLGQAACCLKVNAPDYITKKAWWELPKEIRDRADKNASDLIIKYEEEIKHGCSRRVSEENQLCF